jgi:hypothetical protein
MYYIKNNFYSILIFLQGLILGLLISMYGKTRISQKIRNYREILFYLESYGFTRRPCYKEYGRKLKMLSLMDIVITKVIKYLTLSFPTTRHTR